MSACATITPSLPRVQFHRPERRSLILHDLTAPVVVRTPETPSDAMAQNRAWMQVHESLARRINMRLDIEIAVRWCNRSTYRRMRCASVLVSAPTPQQAELFVKAIHDFAATLDGKWLAERPASDANVVGDGIAQSDNATTENR